MPVARWRYKPPPRRGRFAFTNPLPIQISASDSGGLVYGASDNFNRADGAVGANWIAGAGGNSAPAIATNRVTGHGPGLVIFTMQWAAAVFGATQFSQITNISLPDSSSVGDIAGPTVRDTGSANTSYTAAWRNMGGSSVIQLYSGSGLTGTQLGSDYNVPGNALPVATDVLRIEAVGSTITVKLNGTVVISVTDTSIPSGGAPGAYLVRTASFDDWQGGDPTATPEIASAVSASTPISATDSNGAATEATATRISTSDTNGTTTDAATLVVKISASDSNGTTTEAAAPKIAAPGDTGAGADVITVKAVLAATDANGTTTEATATQISASDTGGSVNIPGGTQVSDNFNRADGALGSNWSGGAETAHTIISNKAASVAGAINLTDLWVGAGSFSNDQFAQMDGMVVGNAVTSVADYIGPAVRMTAGGKTAYHAVYWWQSATTYIISLYKRQAGGETQLGSTYNIPGNVPLLSTDVLRIEVVGSTISLKLNGTVIVSVTDTDLTSGGIGAIGFGQPSFDDWSAGDVAVAVSGESASVAQKVSVSDTDTNGTTTEIIAIVAKPAATDANGATTESGVVQGFASVSGTDANGTTTENALLAAPTSVTDANGVTTDSASIAVPLSSTDANSATTELGTNSRALLSVTDTDGVISEIGTTNTGNLVSAFDVNSTTTEFAQFTYALSVADASGAVTESGTAKVTPLSADSGTSTELQLINMVATVTDTNTFFDSAVLQYLPAQADAGIATELPLAIGFTTGDLAFGSDNFTVGLMSLTDFDTGLGTDTEVLKALGVGIPGTKRLILDAQTIKPALLSAKAEQPALVGAGTEKVEMPSTGRIGGSNY